MKLPRGVSAQRLIRALERLGYTVVRQKGSHVRLFHQAAPVHFDLRSAARSTQDRYIYGILAEVAQAQSISIQGILELL